MNIKEVIRQALQSFTAHKLRSILTTLGIIIGVLAVVAMQTFIQGLNDKVGQELGKIGSSLFYVQKMPAVVLDISKYRNRKNITLEHARALERQSNLASLVAPESYRFGVSIKHAGEHTNPDIVLFGGTESWQQTNGFFVGEGRFFSRFDVEHRRRVCILGITIVEKLFPFKDPVGEQVLIDGNRFEVIGVFQEQGRSFGRDLDNVVLVPITCFEKIFGDRRSMRIAVQADRPELIEEAIDEAIFSMRIARGLEPGEPNDFEIITSDALMETWRNLSTVIFAVAVGVCLISLLVGGVGVMNIMLVSVTERTQEIGILKSVGAKRRDILKQLLIEAIIICQVGGVLGIILGVILAKTIGAITSFPASVPIWSIVLGLGFVSLVGIFFGFYPAVRASRLSPVEALRYE